MYLIDIEAGKTVKIISIQPGHGIEGKLRQLGINPGDCIQVVRLAPLKGPFLVEVNGRSIALGRGVAAKIMVEESSCESH